MRKSLDPVTLFRDVEAAPYRYDFFQLLRLVENAHPDKPRFGTALRPQDEAVRLGQKPDMAFAPATVTGLEPSKQGGPPRVTQAFFGLLGPNGPMPLHLTEFVRERQLHHRDEALVRFLDLLNHRPLSLFYRAWAQAQPTVSYDRPREDRFSAYVGSLVGMGTPATRGRDAAGDHIRFFLAGWMSRQPRSADGLRSLLEAYFRLPVRIVEFAGHWMRLPQDDVTRLGTGRSGCQLGRGAVLGGRVWDRQHRIQVVFGPLDLSQYQSMLPGGDALNRLIALMRHYLCFEVDWDLRLTLDAAQVPQARLGCHARLGWTSWIGKRRRSDPADELILDVERVTAAGA